jgi:hypothetical protein
MLKQFYIFCFLIGMTHFTQAQHLQLIENRGEIGLFAGQSSYRGDIAPDKFKFYNSYGAFFKKNFNDYGGFRLNYEKIRIGYGDSLSMNPYANDRDFFFLRDFHDISLLGEFNFTRYLPGNKSYRFTPYLAIGVGYMFAIVKDSLTNAKSVTRALDDSIKIKNQYLNFPIQLGFKFNITKRVNLFAEFLYRFTANDELDYLVDGKLVSNYQGSRSGKDQFFSVKGGISYNLIKIYGEEKWKPGKRSKLARLFEKDASEDKPGFFSRLKFKRK